MRSGAMCGVGEEVRGCGGGGSLEGVEEETGIGDGGKDVAPRVSRRGRLTLAEVVEAAEGDVAVGKRGEGGDGRGIGRRNGSTSRNARRRDLFRVDAIRLSREDRGGDR